jgi:hypothetical protein
MKDYDLLFQDSFYIPFQYQETVEDARMAAEIKKDYIHNVSLRSDWKLFSFCKYLLVFFSSFLFLSSFASPVQSADTKSLTLLYFGCQEGYLKPCG